MKNNASPELRHDLVFERAQSLLDVQRIAALAREIWYEYYVPIIGREQVDNDVRGFLQDLKKCHLVEEHQPDGTR